MMTPEAMNSSVVYFLIAAIAGPSFILCGLIWNRFHGPKNPKISGEEMQRRINENGSA